MNRMVVVRFVVTALCTSAKLLYSELICSDMGDQVHHLSTIKLTSHLGQFSLAIRSLVGIMSTGTGHTLVKVTAREEVVSSV